MGFFSSLKNMVTGNAAHITISNTSLNLNRPSDLMINIEVKDSDVKSKELYMYLECVHTGNSFTVESKTANDGLKTKEIVINRNVVKTKLFDKRFVIEGSNVYKASQKYSFTVKPEIDTNSLDSIGDDVKWQAFAGIDTAGNDPDSGWVNLDVDCDKSSKVVSAEWYITTFCSISKVIKNLRCEGVFTYVVINNDKFDSISRGLSNYESPEIKGFLSNSIHAGLFGEFHERFNDKDLSEFTLSSGVLFKYLIKYCGEHFDSYGIKLLNFNINSVTLENVDLSKI